MLAVAAQRGRGKAQGRRGAARAPLVYAHILFFLSHAYTHATFALSTHHRCTLCLYRHSLCRNIVHTLWRNTRSLTHSQAIAARYMQCNVCPLEEQFFILPLDDKFGPSQHLQDARVWVSASTGKIRTIDAATRYVRVIGREGAEACLIWSFCENFDWKLNYELNYDYW